MKIILSLLVLYFFSCKPGSSKTGSPLQADQSLKENKTLANGSDTNEVIVATGARLVNTGNIHADTVVSFAESLVGTPYKYASTDPSEGFDCSGFITYVFNHFSIDVPRSSKDFENAGDLVLLLGAKRGDLILFTGTDSTDRSIGHMGIITANDHGDVYFVHSSSGKANGVTETLLNKYYLKRYVKTIRIFNY